MKNTIEELLSGIDLKTIQTAADDNPHAIPFSRTPWREGDWLIKLLSPGYAVAQYMLPEPALESIPSTPYGNWGEMCAALPWYFGKPETKVCDNVRSIYRHFACLEIEVIGTWRVCSHEDYVAWLKRNGKLPITFIGYKKDYKSPEVTAKEQRTLAQWMETRNHSQSAAAKILGVSQATVSRWLKGQREIPPEILAKLV